MSRLIDFARVNAALKAHSMPTAHRLVMFVMCQHANQANGDRAWPSLITLRDETGIGRTKLVEVIAELVAFGWLVPDGNVGEGLRRASRYEVITDGKPWPEDSRAKSARSTERANHARRTAARTSHVPPGDTLADRPAIRLLTADHDSSFRAAVTNRQGTDKENKQEEQTIALAPALARNESEAESKATPSAQPSLFDLPEAPKPDVAKRDIKPPKPSPTKRKVSLPVEPDPSVLDPKQRAVFDAIAADQSLRPICLGPVQLAVDLCNIAPLVDVPLAVKSAGAWMRGDPTDRNRRKTKGNSFLANWVTRENDRLAALPQPAKPVNEKPYVPPLNPRPWVPPKNLNRELVVATQAELLAKYGPLEDANGKRESA